MGLTLASSIWRDKIYVVQTSTKVIQRCLLMTTDPGDLVFDPTCGSGTTAYVAEQWGRRWITCDTSRVALTLAKQRLMTAVFDYYELAHPQEGVGSGFNYKTVPHVTLKSIANNEPPGTETLYDQPLVDRKKHRVSGPFTVEAVPAPAVKSVDEIAGRTRPQPRRRLHRPLRRDPAPGRMARRTAAHRHPRQGGPEHPLRPAGAAARLPLAARRRRNPPQRRGHGLGARDGPAYTPQRIVVSFGPEHAPLEQRQVAQAIEEAQTLVPKPKLIVFAAFQFDPEAAKDIDETNWPGVTLLKAQMNADLLTDDLKKKRASNECFWLIGQPDVRLERIAKGEDKGKWRVSVTASTTTTPGPAASNRAARTRSPSGCWTPTTTGAACSRARCSSRWPAKAKAGRRLAKNLKAEIDEELIEAYRGTVSLPFEPGEHKRIAVKIVDDRGIESLKVLEVE